MQITNASQLRGVFPALFTPLKDDDPKNLRNSIDYKKMEKMIVTTHIGLILRIIQELLAMNIVSIQIKQIYKIC